MRARRTRDYPSSRKRSYNGSNGLNRVGKNKRRPRIQERTRDYPSSRKRSYNSSNGLNRVGENKRRRRIPKGPRVRQNAIDIFNQAFSKIGEDEFNQQLLCLSQMRGHKCPRDRRNVIANTLTFALMSIVKERNRKKSDCSIENNIKAFTRLASHYRDTFHAPRYISILLHRYGVLAKYRLLPRGFRLNRDLLDDLLPALLSGRPNSQDVANALWALAKLGEEHRLPSGYRLDVELLDGLLPALLSGRPNSQNVANTLWGLAKLGEEHRLPSGYRLDVELLIGLLSALLSGRPNSQSVANVLWALAKLGEEHCLPKGFRLDRELLGELLSALWSCTPNSQDVANTLWGLAKLGEEHRLPKGFKLTTLMLENLLSALLSGRPNSQGVANTLWGLAKLGEEHRLPSSFRLDVELLIGLLSALLSGRPNSQNVANALWGLAKLGEEHCLPKGFKLTTSMLEKLLSALWLGKPNSQGVANALWGLAKLGEEHRLPKGFKLTTSMLEKLLSALLSGRPNSQDVAITLWGLAKLGEEHRLPRGFKLTTSMLEKLLLALLSGKPNSQDVANTLWGLAKLGEEHCLPKGFKLTTSMLEKLLLALLSGRPNSQNVANTLWGLAKLGKEHRLPKGFKLTTLMLEKLLSALLSGRPNSQNVANTLWALAKLGEEHCLPKGFKLTTSMLEKLLLALWSGTPNSQEVANTLWALAKFGEEHRLPRGFKLTTSMLEKLLPALLSGRPNSQDVAMTLWGLAKLGEEHRLPRDFRLDMDLLVDLLSALWSGTPNSQNVANTLWGLAKLGEEHRLPKGFKLTTLMLENLLSALLSGTPNSQEVANTLWALGKLNELGYLSGLEEPKVSELIWSIILTFSSTQTQSAQHIYQLTKGLQLLLPSLDTTVADEAVKQCIEIISALPHALRMDRKRYQAGTVIAALSCLQSLLQRQPDERKVIDPTAFAITLDKCLRYVEGARLNDSLREQFLSVLVFFSAIDGLETMLTSRAVKDFLAREKAMATPRFAEVLRTLLAKVSLPDPPVVLEMEADLSSPELRFDEEIILPAYREVIKPQCYDLKNKDDETKLQQYFRGQDITFIKESKRRRPAINIGPIGVLGDQLGAYAGEDIIVGVSGKRLLGEYEGDLYLNGEIPDEHADSQYIFDHVSGAAIDAWYTRNWTALINHREEPNVVAEDSYDENGDPVIYLYAVRKIKRGEPLYLDYGPSYFCNLGFTPWHLGVDDRMLSLRDLYQQYRHSYEDKAHTFNVNTARTLGLQANQEYVVTRLFKAVFAGEIDKVNKLLTTTNSHDENLPPLALARSDIDTLASQENITPFMLACYLGEEAVITKFLEHYANLFDKENDVNPLLRRCWHSGQTALSFLLKGHADEKVKVKVVKTLWGHCARALERTVKHETYVAGLYEDIMACFTRIDNNDESLLSYCIRYRLLEVAKILFEQLPEEIHKVWYQSMYECVHHADLRNCIEGGDWAMLALLVKHAPDKAELLDKLGDGTINLEQLSLYSLHHATFIFEEHLHISKHAAAHERLQVAKQGFTLDLNEDLPPGFFTCKGKGKAELLDKLGDGTINLEQLPSIPKHAVAHERLQVAKPGFKDLPPGFFACKRKDRSSSRKRKQCELKKTKIDPIKPKKGKVDDILAEMASFKK